MRTGGQETGMEAEAPERAGCSLCSDLPQDRCLRDWPGSLQDSGLDLQPPRTAAGPRTQDLPSPSLGPFLPL